MISICMTTGNSQGNVEIMDTTACQFGVRPARVARTACLDGTVHISHSGLVEGDRTFYVDCPITEAQETRINYIHENSTSVLIGCREGLFLGTISEISTENGRLEATILIKSKEDD